MNLKKKIFFATSILLATLALLSINVNYAKAIDSEVKSNDKIIYLTFDDGPGGKITTKVLDILKEEKVPATFFLIGNQIKGQEHLLNRMKDEGHSLGLHSMTHSRNNLYSSNANFLKEMLDCQKLIEDAVGVKPTILRFPFGCNNNTYKLKEQLVTLLHENNLKIFDWNLDSTDGANHTGNPSTFIKHSKSDKEYIVLLMHCGFQNANSAKALPEIIKYYKDKGYEFRAISNDTQEIFHYIK